MKSRKQDKPRNDSPRRERRAFTEEFKRQAVQLMHERRAQGVTLSGNPSSNSCSALSPRVMSIS